MIIRDCLGREREPDKTYPDGSYNCPFCWAAVIAEYEGHTPGCKNPGCTARVNERGELDFPRDRAEERLKAEQERKAEEKRRADLEEFRRDYAAERSRAQQERLTAALVECRDRKACERCLLKALGGGFGKAKFIKHRGPCPLAPKAHPGT
jgi:hypothetical protein